MWVDDGSNAVQAGSTATEFVIRGKPSAGSPVNARFTEPLTPEVGYFEIDVVEGGAGAFVGVTTLASFKKGWGCKGLFFGGNLSNGGALVQSKFGEHLAPGMTIGVRCEFVEGAERQVRITFWQDGKCLGPAFLSKMADAAAEVFPCVHANGDNDKYVIRMGGTPPAGGGSAPPAHFAVGKWQLASLQGPDIGDYPFMAKMEGEVVGLQVTSSAPGTFELGFQVANGLGMRATSAPDAALAPFEALVPDGPPIATRMMGPPGMMEVEEQITRGMQGLTKWMVQGGLLILSGPTVEMTLAPAAGGGGAGGPASTREVLK